MRLAPSDVRAEEELHKPWLLCMHPQKDQGQCDERKPACDKCRRKGIHCPGYRHTDDLHFRNALVSHGKSQTSDRLKWEEALTFTGVSSIGRLPASLTSQDAHDSMSLHYFRTLAAHDFQGYLRSEFWSSTMYQKSVCYPGVHHALIAVSDAHREWRTNASTTLSNGTLMQYGKALRITIAEAQEVKARDPYVASLYSCILLYLFELLNRNSAAAGVHLENGLSLLREWYSTSTTWPPTELNPAARAEFYQLLYTIGRLDLEQSLSGVVSRQHTKTLRLLREGLRPVFAELPSAFSVECLLLLLSLRTVYFMSSAKDLLGLPASQVPQDVLSRQAVLQQRVDAILSMLDRFQSTIDQTSMSGRQKMMAVYIMRLYLISNRIHLAGMFAAVDGEVVKPYDKYANEMLEYAASAVDLRCTPPLRQDFMPEPGIIAPLRRLASEVSQNDTRFRAYAIIDRLSFAQDDFEGKYLADS